MEMLIILIPMGLMMWFMTRQQKKQQQAHLDKLNSVEKGAEIITIGGMYAIVDEVDRDANKVVLDVDGVYLTFELSAIKTILSSAVPTTQEIVSDSIVGKSAVVAAEVEAVEAAEPMPSAIEE
ncbi:preprotein translocase subunit YajC [Streptococcus caprae]|uniref:Preprotein translocase subunit YajC n=1 Tax=Streptococcus caprae TaxID=1640501 RepID=A0ABV8CTW2_9STRE